MLIKVCCDILYVLGQKINGSPGNQNHKFSHGILAASYMYVQKHFHGVMVVFTSVCNDHNKQFMDDTYVHRIFTYIINIFLFTLSYIIKLCACLACHEYFKIASHASLHSGKNIGDWVYINILHGLIPWVGCFTRTKSFFFEYRLV